MRSHDFFEACKRTWEKETQLDVTVHYHSLISNSISYVMLGSEVIGTHGRSEHDVRSVLCIGQFEA